MCLFGTPHLRLGDKAFVASSMSDNFSSAIWLAIHIYRRQYNKGQALDLSLLESRYLQVSSLTVHKVLPGSAYAEADTLSLIMPCS